MRAAEAWPEPPDLGPQEGATSQIHRVQGWSEFLSLFTELRRVQLKDSPDKDKNNSIFLPESCICGGGKNDRKE